MTNFFKSVIIWTVGAFCLLTVFFLIVTILGAITVGA